jgi:hypothetical protein
MANKPDIPTYDNDSKNCLEEWQTDLGDVTNQLEISFQEKSGLGSKSSNASIWEGKLRMFWLCIERTEELTQDISGHLELFLEQTELVCKNIDCSQLVLRLLYCKVRKIYECTDSLREKLLDFFMKVDCLGDENISAKGSFIVECITNLSAKLDLAVAKQQELLKKMIDILKCIDELRESICDDECGVEGQIRILIEIFKRSADESPSCEIEKSCYQELEPKPVLPLNTERVYVFTHEQQRLAEQEKKEIKLALEEACKEYESLASCKNSLSEAIECSKAVQECK